MNYIETKIFTSKQGLEPLSSILIEMGITDFVIEDPTELAELLDKKQPYEWDYIGEEVLALGKKETSIILYLEDTEQGNKTLRKIKLAAMELKSKEIEGVFGADVSLGRLYVENQIVNDETWKDNWKEFFKTSKVTNRIVIKPTWEEYKDKKGELVIEIDPGMAFGTGTHPTTSMCMKFLERYAGQFKTVLDIGCGSGILSITAALFGASEVLGVEIDPQAANIARENVELNGFTDRIQIVEGDLTKRIDFKGDIIVANLMADLVMLLSEDAPSSLKEAGLFITSGILVEKLEEVKSVIKTSGFEIIDILEENEWCAILARLKKRAG